MTSGPEPIVLPIDISIRVLDDPEDVLEESLLVALVCRLLPCLSTHDSHLHYPELLQLPVMLLTR